MRKDCQCPLARHEHGTYLGYLSDGCRCGACTVAWRFKATHQRRIVQARTWGQPDMRPAALVPAAPTTLRLQALAVLGYGVPEIVSRIGGHASDLSVVRLGKLPTVRLATHNRIERLYDELWATPSTHPRAEQTRSRARKHGWVPPLALDDDAMDKMRVTSSEDFDHIRLLDYTNILHPGISADDQGNSPDLIDEIAVEQAMTGRRVHLNRAETSEAIARLTRVGWSAEQIGERLGITSRTVVRFRARAGESVAA